MHHTACTLEYGPLNQPTTTHVVPERYNKIELQTELIKKRAYLSHANWMAETCAKLDLARYTN